MQVRLALLVVAALALPAAALAAGAPPAEPDPDVRTYGVGVQGYQAWAKTTFSAISFRFQSSEELWIAMSDSYGPYPTEALAARAAGKYLEFDPGTDRMKVVLFRSNQRVAEATVDRGR